MSKILPNEKFFDLLSEDYDSMIPFSKAVKKKEKMLKNIITPAMKYAADIGCGTGTDSIALAHLGLNVTSFDPSRGMIEKAKLNASGEGVKIDFNFKTALNIPEEFSRNFDIVTSFGNTFANIGKDKFDISLMRCFDLLKKGGVLVIQILNYHRILAEKNRIISISENDSNLFIRFYDFETDCIVFNSLKTKRPGFENYSLISTRLYPHLKHDFEKCLCRLNCSSVDFYSDLRLNPFNGSLSKDLVVLCTR